MAIQLAQGADEAVSSINTTPLVDVMLVLLIIFLITIPVVNFSVPVELPKQRNEVRESEPKDVVITVARDGRLYWFDAPVANQAAL
ncbi:biopolymer transporter ExbD, partial [Klebsiella pneumoniae]